MLTRWWHRKVLRHTIRVNRTISVPSFDISAKGVLYTCTCKKTWAY